jgi:hypothetical protein
VLVLGVLSRLDAFFSRVLNARNEDILEVPRARELIEVRSNQFLSNLAI